MIRWLSVGVLLAGCGDSRITSVYTNLEPNVVITWPTDASRVSADTALVFVAVAGDPESDVDELSVSWTSSVDGPLLGDLAWAGDEVSMTAPSGLSSGPHTLTVTVADPDGATAQAETTVVAVENQPPTVVFTAPVDAEHVLVNNERFRLEATVSDLEDAVGSLTLTWDGDIADVASLPSVAPASGELSTLLPELSPGIHLLSLSVRDSDGAEAFAETSFRVVVDADNDGIFGEDDCNDDDANAFPGADERCNGADDDCNGLIDDAAVDATNWYVDLDGDEFGDQALAVIACDPPDETYTSTSGDCDDTRAQIYPGAPELCNGLDDDCDTLIDENPPEWALDDDGDGFGDPENTVPACEAPNDSYVLDQTDCDDTLEQVNPGADELCNDRDDNCNTVVDEDPVDPVPWYLDGDGDDYGITEGAQTACLPPTDAYVAEAGDCDDASASVHPGADELCNGTDDDCDEVIDNDPVDAPDWYVDVDGDAYGNPDSAVSSCEVPSGNYIATSGDCDDARNSVNPDATEVCNGRDDDCDDLVDEDPPEWALDSDGDGFGDPDNTVAACDRPGDDYVRDQTDCDDASEAVNPGAPELCNDDNCNVAIDEDAVDPTSWYLDEDGDDYGVASTAVSACEPPTSSHVATAGDCDDVRSFVYPGAPEQCNGRDDDCDDAIDEIAPTWIRDADSDGYGDSSDTVMACDAPASDYILDTGAPADCNDSAAGVNPGADEVCNGTDDNCDDAVDNDAVDAPTWYTDVDNDTFGAASSAATVCEPPNANAILNGGDCDDGRAAVNPDATEVCNGRDDNCDDRIDDNPPEWALDGDGDGYGDPDVTVAVCDRPSAEYVRDQTDCDDSRDSVYPDAPEQCNDRDDNCDGLTDNNAVDVAPWYLDADADLYGTAASEVFACEPPTTDYVGSAGDCDDGRPFVYPGAPEQCNGLDDNCDDVVDEVAPTWIRDADGDGYGNPSDTVAACDAPASNYILDIGSLADCNDSAAAVNPGADEVCNGADDNCDDVVDNDAVDAPTWYADIDDDSYGSVASAVEVCEPPNATYISTAGDCDDGRASVNPDATEVCNGRDDNCDDRVDENPPEWALDDDGDGYGDPDVTVAVCDRPSADYVRDQTDCDDSRDSVFPGGEELCNDRDDNCDGLTDNDAADVVPWYEDSDADLYGNADARVFACDAPTAEYVSDAGDCDDTRDSVRPGAPELCNGRDDNCDGTIDEEAPTWFLDSDGDGYGNADSSVVACEPPTSRYVSDATDCNDNAIAINPGADEVCNGLDDDCNTAVDDDASDVVAWYPDADGDDYGNENAQTMACFAPTPTHIRTGDDCDDTRVSVNPDGEDVCNGLDDNCDDRVDENPLVWAFDGDGDDYGNPAVTVVSCEPPNSRYISDQTDCDDSRASSYPGAPEVCNGRDDNCDGQTDISAVDEVPWYLDADGDLYGFAASEVFACDAPTTDYVRDDSDCDDTRSTVRPGAPELCNGRDDNCDGTVDEGAPTWFLDNDADGYGTSDSGIVACDPPNSRYVSDATDCNDNAIAINPGADEVCNGLDDDCNTAVDDDASDVVAWYPDADGDDYGNQNAQQMACFAPTPDYIRTGHDCDDTRSAVNPDGEDICNGLDDNCDGDVDENPLVWALDDDGDDYGDASVTVLSCNRPSSRYVSDQTDCNDADAQVFPGAVERCNDSDDSCDGVADSPAPPSAATYYTDDDGDGYGDPDTAVVSCTPPGGDVTEVPFDCDDADPSINPDALEMCDGVDNDCDGQIEQSFDVPEDYATPQEAVDAASSGDLVCIAPGRYVDNVSIINKSLRMYGSGRGVTTIVNGGNGSVMRLGGAATPSLLADLTLEGGRGNLGAGLWIRSSSPTVERVEIVDSVCEITENGRCPGTAVYVDNSAARLRDITIDGVTPDGLILGQDIYQGFAMYMHTFSGEIDGLEITNVEVDHRQQHGAALFIRQMGGWGDRKAINNLYVHDNYISTSGRTKGLVHFSQSHIDLNHARIIDNHTEGGDSAGTLYGWGVALELYNSVILDNQVGGPRSNVSRGGGIALEQGFLDLINTDVVGNQVRAFSTWQPCFGAGVVIVSTTGTATFLNSNIVNNELICALPEGGGFYDATNSPSSTATYTNFWGNTEPQFHAFSHSNASQGDYSVDPQFFNIGFPDARLWDLRLRSTSPLRNMGDPNAAYNDPDGSRNDPGSRGGPDAL